MFYDWRMLCSMTKECCVLWLKNFVFYIWLKNGVLRLKNAKMNAAWLKNGYLVATEELCCTLCWRGKVTSQPEPPQSSAPVWTHWQHITHNTSQAAAYSDEEKGSEALLRFCHEKLYYILKFKLSTKIKFRGWLVILWPKQPSKI